MRRRKLGIMEWAVIAHCALIAVVVATAVTVAALDEEARRYAEGAWGDAVVGEARR